MGPGDRNQPFTWTVSAEPGEDRGWGTRLALAISAVIIAGWPLLFWLVRSEPGYHHWLRGIALPWWILVTGVALVVKLARITTKR